MSHYINVEVLTGAFDNLDPDENEGYAMAWTELNLGDGPSVLYVTDVEGETFFTNYQLTADGAPSFKVAYVEDSGEVMVEVQPMGVGA